MLVEKTVWIGGKQVPKLIWEPDPPEQEDRWIPSESLVGLEVITHIPPWWSVHTVGLPVVDYQHNQALAARLGLTEDMCWKHDSRHLIILHHGCGDPQTRLPSGESAARGHCFYDAAVAIKHTRIMSDWVSKEVERSAQRQRIKQRLDAEAADLARQYMERERTRAHIEKQQLENTPEARMRKLEAQMREVMEENKRLRNGGSHDEASQ
jgi:hypothetical protein